MHLRSPARRTLAALAAAVLLTGLSQSVGVSSTHFGAVQAQASYETEPPTEWGPSETRTYDVTIVNTGEVGWKAGGARRVRLSVSFGGRSDDPSVGRITDQRFNLPKDVEPGERLTMEVRVTAPSRPANYLLRHQLVIERGAWFDDLDRAEVQVVSGWPIVIVLGAIVAAVLGGTGWYVARSTRRQRR